MMEESALDLATANMIRMKRSPLAIVSLVAATLIACDPAVSVVVRNHCDVPIWVRVNGTAAQLASTPGERVEPGQTFRTQSVGTRSTVGWATKDEAPKATRLIRRGSPAVIVAGSDCG